MEYFRIKYVHSYEALLSTSFGNGVNALCWQRKLPGDFEEVVKSLGKGEGILPVDEALLISLPVTEAGKIAVDRMLEDLRVLRENKLEPVLNCIHGYPRDDSDGPVLTDVFSFHADRAPIEADTWLCTFQGLPSEGLRNEEATRRIDMPGIRKQLLEIYGGADDVRFCEFLSENCYDLHYAPNPEACPFSFGIGNLWRIALEYPGSPVPPCIHRAPETPEGSVPRLLLIS